MFGLPRIVATPACTMSQYCVAEYTSSPSSDGTHRDTCTAQTSIKGAVWKNTPSSQSYDIKTTTECANQLFKVELEESSKNLAYLVFKVESGKEQQEYKIPGFELEMIIKNSKDQNYLVFKVEVVNNSKNQMYPIFKVEVVRKVQSKHT